MQRYGGIYEHSAWVAEETYAATADVSDTDVLAKVFAGCVDDASHDRKLALIRAHPDLAGKAAIAGDLTEESTAEQSSAGIDQCTPEEYEQFQMLNEQYKTKFGFPFVTVETLLHKHPSCLGYELLSSLGNHSRRNHVTPFIFLWVVYVRS